jgi:hypothetical protein
MIIEQKYLKSKSDFPDCQNEKFVRLDLFAYREIIGTTPKGIQRSKIGKGKHLYHVQGPVGYLTAENKHLNSFIFKS